MAAQTYFSSLNDKERELLAVNEPLIQAMYKEYALAEKVYEYLIADINPEISIHTYLINQSIWGYIFDYIISSICQIIQASHPSSYIFNVCLSSLNKDIQVIQHLYKFSFRFSFVASAAFSRYFLVPFPAFPNCSPIKGSILIPDSAAFPLSPSIR